MSGVPYGATLCSTRFEAIPRADGRSNVMVLSLFIVMLFSLSCSNA